MKYLKMVVLSLVIVLCFGFIFGAEIDGAYAEKSEQLIYLGGQSIGIVAKTNGVIITGIIDIITKNGLVSPAKNSGILIGDIILEIDGIKIESDKDIGKAIETKEKINMKIERAGANEVFELKPALDIISNTLKLGLLVKNDINGIGTLTYVRTDNFRFGGLGHPIADAELKLKYEFNCGIICESTIIGIEKGGEGKAGSIKGKITPIVKYGNLDKNINCGIFGNFNPKYCKNFIKVKTADRSLVRMGNAQIYTSIDGETPQYYEIEIVKAEIQDKPQEKSMVIRILDKALIEKTGGIVQGMSGSPILQNGKLIGAVTHVFLNDATKGYGIYIDWMIGN